MFQAQVPDRHQADRAHLLSAVNTGSGEKSLLFLLSVKKKMCKLLMACITDAGQNSQGGRSFFYWYSADIEQQFACFSSSSASGAALSRAGHDCSAAYRLDGRLTSALTGLWSTSLLRAAFTVQLLHRSTANRPMTQNTRSLQRLGGGAQKRGKCFPDDFQPGQR